MRSGKRNERNHFPLRLSHWVLARHQHGFPCGSVSVGEAGRLECGSSARHAVRRYGRGSHHALLLRLRRRPRLCVREPQLVARSGVAAMRGSLATPIAKIHIWMQQLCLHRSLPLFLDRVAY